MKIYHQIVKLSLVFVVYFICSSYYKTTLKDDDKLWVTKDTHSNWIAWDHADSKIAFSSNYQGTSNIYYIDLQQLKIEKSSKGLYIANYLDKLSPKNTVYVPVTNTKDTSFFQAEWSFTGNEIACLGNYNSTNELMIVNTSTKELLGTKIFDVSTINWYNPSTILYVLNSDNKKVYSYDVNTKESTLFHQLEMPIIGVSGKIYEVLLITNDGIYEINKQRSEEYFPMPINCEKAYHLNRLNFLATNTKKEAVIIDLNNKVMNPILIGGEQGTVTLSNNKQFVAFTSSGLGGIVIKRIGNSYK